MNQPMLIQFHILRSLPVNLANSGQDGGPKTMQFGGVTRARLSSQSIKARLRASSFFRSGELPMSIRTAALPEYVRRELQAMGADEQMTAAIVEKLLGLGKKEKPKKGEGDGKAEAQDGVIEAEGQPADESAKETGHANTKTINLVGAHEPREIALYFASLYDELGPKKFAATALDKLSEDFRGAGTRAIDAALFGRFSTSGLLDNVNAACSIAHSFSTHAARPQIDWFVAREESPFGDKANPMVGEQAFSSACHYLYANLDLRALVENLYGDVDLTKKGLAAFVQALISPQSVPAGKEHVMAVPVLPDLVMVELAQFPVSYASAFERPVRTQNGQSQAEASAEALKEYVANAEQKFGYRFERRVLSMLPSWPSDETAQELVSWLAGLAPEPEAA